MSTFRKCFSWQFRPRTNEPARYHIHENVKRHIDYITPAVKSLATRRSRRHSASATKVEKRMVKPQNTPLPSSLTLAEVVADPLANCDQTISPGCIRRMYNFTAATTAHPGNEIGVFERGLPYDQTDLDDFFSNVHPLIPNGTHPIHHSIDGGNPFSSTPVAGEANLDFELIYPIIWPQQSVVFETDDSYYSSQGGLPHDSGYFNTFLDGIDGSYCEHSRPYEYCQAVSVRHQPSSLKTVNKISIDACRPQLNTAVDFLERLAKLIYRQLLCIWRDRR